MSTIIGLVSTFRLPLQKPRESPKGARNRDRLDDKAEIGHNKVQSQRITPLGVRKNVDYGAAFLRAALIASIKTEYVYLLAES